MAIEYIKKASKTSATGEDDTREIVSRMLKEIEEGGEEKALEYASKLDKWPGGSPVLTREQIDAASALVPQQEKMTSSSLTNASALSRATSATV